MKFTVVTPSYNQRQFIEETITSVLAQTGIELEYIIIDGGSTDGSQEIIEQYADRLAYWHSRPDRGQSDAVNQGWSRATGEIVCWLNSDDTFLPGALAAAAEQFTAFPEAGIVVGDCLFCDKDGRPLRRSPARRPFDYREFIVGCENSIPQPSAFVRRRVIEDVGLLDTELPLLMDWEFWMRAGKQHEIRYTPQLWSTYRLHADSKTVSQHSTSLPAELELIYNSYFQAADVPEMLHAEKPRAFANMYLTAAGYALEGGFREAARAWARKGFAAARLEFLKPRMLHKLAYCYWGRSAAYSKVRSAFRTLRNSSGSLNSASTASPSHGEAL